jgi:hypothetical protein
VFDAEWTLLDGRPLRAEVTISIQGNRVTVQRRNATSGGDCEVVNGTLSADGVIVTGVSDCNHPEGRASSCFFARIVCDGQANGCGIGTRLRVTDGEEAVNNSQQSSQ